MGLKRSAGKTLKRYESLSTPSLVILIIFLAAIVVYTIISSQSVKLSPSMQTTAIGGEEFPASFVQSLTPQEKQLLTAGINSGVTESEKVLINDELSVGKNWMESQAASPETIQLIMDVFQRAGDAQQFMEDVQAQGPDSTTQTQTPTQTAGEAETISEGECTSQGGECTQGTCNVPPDQYLGICTRSSFPSVGVTGICCKRGASSGQPGDDTGSPVSIGGKVAPGDYCKNVKGGGCKNSCDADEKIDGICFGSTAGFYYSVEYCCVKKEGSTQGGSPSSGGEGPAGPTTGSDQPRPKKGESCGKWEIVGSESSSPSDPIDMECVNTKLCDTGLVCNRKTCMCDEPESTGSGGGTEEPADESATGGAQTPGDTPPTPTPPTSQPPPITPPTQPGSDANVPTSDGIDTKAECEAGGGKCAGACKSDENEEIIGTCKATNFFGSFSYEQMCIKCTKIPSDTGGVGGTGGEAGAQQASQNDYPQCREDCEYCSPPTEKAGEGNSQCKKADGTLTRCWVCAYPPKGSVGSDEEPPTDKGPIDGSGGLTEEPTAGNNPCNPETGKRADGTPCKKGDKCEGGGICGGKCDDKTEIERKGAICIDRAWPWPNEYCVTCLGLGKPPEKKNGGSGGEPSSGGEGPTGPFTGGGTPTPIEPNPSGGCSYFDDVETRTANSLYKKGEETKDFSSFLSFCSEFGKCASDTQVCNRGCKCVDKGGLEDDTGGPSSGGGGPAGPVTGGEQEKPCGRITPTPSLGTSRRTGQINEIGGTPEETVEVIGPADCGGWCPEGEACGIKGRGCGCNKLGPITTVETGEFDTGAGANLVSTVRNVFAGLFTPARSETTNINLQTQTSGTTETTSAESATAASTNIFTNLFTPQVSTTTTSVTSATGTSTTQTTTTRTAGAGLGMFGGFGGGLGGGSTTASNTNSQTSTMGSGRDTTSSTSDSSEGAGAAASGGGLFRNLFTPRL